MPSSIWIFSKALIAFLRLQWEGYFHSSEIREMHSVPLSFDDFWSWEATNHLVF